ncbi:diacylglycerol kinase [Actinomyces bowdenii]|uniref:diacylglycerol/lipid kinase family protein n=1 Tax=Actinomyces bowdenii TaxID=131109 RepID=UPI00214AB67D|nr:diacylglycerol kinase family protein [Actinomyces bowdenii]MCR2052192.1 diacylglycerol kinase [Actinomyces bowdenii]
MTATRRTGRAGHGGSETNRPLACVVINPSKRKATRAVSDLLARRLREAGFRGPIWLETSGSEPGATQARLAVASGARLVVAAGGDGTVRSVAAGLASTSLEMGIMPLGTANLAARNLGLPTTDLAQAAEVLASGSAGPYDLAWVSTDAHSETGTEAGAETGTATGTETSAGGSSLPGAPGAASGRAAASAGPAASPAPATVANGISWARPTLGHEHACMVVAGIGFDAGLVAATHPGLKARIGWGAYALAAMSNLRSPRMDLVLSLAGEPGSASDAAAPSVPPRPTPGGEAPSGTGLGSGPPRTAPSRGGRRVERLTARSLLVANGGRLPAGITLLPRARLDDGLLDIAAIDTVAGLVGWGSLARQVLPPYAAAYADPERATGRVLLRQGNDVTVRLAAPALVEVDGDLLPPTQGVHVRLEAGALRIRRP